MNIIYTGKKPELTEAAKKRVAARVAKVSKLVDGKGEKEMHVIFSSQRYLTKAEATLNYRGHAAVGAAQDADATKALMMALERLETQVLKFRAKWRDTSRANTVEPLPPPPPAVSKGAAADPARSPRIQRITVNGRRKPMTVDEAILVIGKNDPYFAFRDALTGNVAVLIRRGAEFDLVEA